jgi:PAS domain S-box-containing protein
MITDKPREETNAKALRAAELRYRRLFETAKDGILILDAGTGMVVDVNPFLVELLGFSREVFFEKKVWELGFFKDIAANEEKFAELQARKYVRYDDLPLETADGRQIAVEFVSNVYRENHHNVIQCNIRDIRVRKKTETAMINSEARYRRLFEAAKDGILIINAETGRIVDVNPFLIDLLGYTAENFVGKHIWELGFFKDIAASKAKFEELQAKDYIRYDDLALETSDGRRVDVEFVSNAYMVDHHRVIQCNIRDISERKRKDEALCVSEEITKGILNSIPVRVFWKDTKLFYLGCNMEFARDAGFAEPKDIIGKDDYKMGWRDQAELFRGADRQVIDGGSSKLLMEEPQTTPEGKTITLLTSKVPLRDSKGEICGVLGTYMDITERKATEARMRLQSSALEAAANAIVITDSKGVIEWANAAFTTFTGYSVEEAIGKTPSLLKSGKHDEKFYHNLWETVSTGKVWHGELINRRKDGTLYTEEMTITPMKDSLNGVTHFIAVKQDITERKKLEAQFLRVQRMESIGTLAGGIAHDLNNVLAPILMAVEILGEKITDDAGRETLATLEASAQHGAELVRQVLGFARGMEGQRIIINPVHIVRDVEKIIRDTFPKNIDFSFGPSRDLWTVTGDPTQLHQVFTNLCVNARDAMPHGGSLTVTMENVEMDDVYAEMNPDSKPGAYVMVKVIDTGTGMPPKIIERIFEPFFTTKEIGKGTGMGLSTTMAIVKSHGGFITVYSEMGKGTTFKVYLPANKISKADETSSTKQAQLPRGNGELVLVVDDDEHIRAIALKILERFGYRVLHAANGAEAIAVYAQHREDIAIVLTDMDMPVMDGTSTLIALKAMNPQVKVIASSGLKANEINTQAAEAGFKNFIPKPYTTETMLNILAKALREQT